MIRALLLAAALAQPAASPVAAPVTTPLKTLEATAAGQPIVLPQGAVHATISETVVPAHGLIPPHKHPYPRYVFVAEGQLRVTNLVTGQVYELKTGDLSVDPVDQWHKAEALGDTPARIIALDQAPPGVPNTIRQTP